ncbi:hypothetical protein WBG78_30660 [Chryseolinea sp. T2]|uniref:hypothetical protein n=1 Tax=Chryseolinea sp. T2 TaxID=3129255 RepID=UPI00307693B9
MKSIHAFNLVSLICLSGACNRTQNIEIKDLRGIWVVAEDTSLVVIYDRDFFLHRKDEGDMYLDYSVSRDSIELSRHDIPVFKRKVILVSNDEFLVTDSATELRFSRIKAKVDTARLRSLVNWLKQPPIYSEDYSSQRALKFDEAQAIWLSMTKASH